MTFHKTLDSFYLCQKEPNKSCLLVLRDILLKQDKNITETLKYGLPCFCYNGKMMFYLWVEKKSTWPYILFVDGIHLTNPDLEQGDRKQMKIYLVNPNIDIPLETLKIILDEAISWRKQNTK